MRADKKETLIFIPTYNEAENVEKIYNQIKALNLDTDILFLDDNSPDGTGKIIDNIIAKNKNVFVIHRSGKLGIGSAHKEGIKYAYNKKYETLITMDCDFTHSPEYIKDFINNSEDYDVVVGSRFLKKDSLSSWNLFRKFMTYLGHFLTFILLNMPYDASGAFRLYKLDKIKPGVFDLVQSNGYSFFFESLFILHMNKYKIREIPTELPARTYGHSKMTLKDIRTSIIQLLTTFKRKILNKETLIYNYHEK